MHRGKWTTIAAVAALAYVANGVAAKAEDTLKIGLLATFEGAFTVLGEDSKRGAELALKEHNGMAGGKKIEWVVGSSDASPDSAIRAVRKLVEQDGVKIVVGPLSGDEGLAVKDYAKTQPNVTFVNGTSAAQDTTLRNPAPNFFRFTTDGAQWMAGLGTYAYQKKGYKKGRHRRRGLLLPLHAGLRLHGRVLQGGRPCPVEVLGADRQQGLFLGDRRHSRRRRCRLCRPRRC